MSVKNRINRISQYIADTPGMSPTLLASEVGGMHQTTIKRILDGTTKNPSANILDRIDAYIDGRVGDRRQPDHDRRQLTKQEASDLRFLIDTLKDELIAVRAERDELKTEIKRLKEDASKKVSPPKLSRGQVDLDKAANS